MTWCQVIWRDFGLGAPDYVTCTRHAAARIVQACIHEHISEALICVGCLDYMRSLDEPFGTWGCETCGQNSPRHQCRAPLIVLPPWGRTGGQR